MNAVVNFPPRKSSVASLEAEIRLKQTARMFESAEERRRREALEQLRSEDHLAIKRWLEEQMVFKPVKEPVVMMKGLDYLIGLLLFAGGVISIIFVGAVFGLIMEL